MGGSCCICDCCIADCGFCCIFDFCSDSGCDYHPKENNTAERAKKIAGELEDMKKRASKDGQEIGKSALDEINASLNKFISDLTQVNAKEFGGKKLNIQVEVLQEELDKLKSEITSFVGDRLNERLVLTDPELNPILNEPNDDKRAKNFNQFYVKIHKQAVNDLSKKIESCVKKQFEIVKKVINTRLSEVDRSISDSYSNYKKGLQMLEEKGQELSNSQVDCMYSISLADIVLKIVNPNNK